MSSSSSAPQDSKGITGSGGGGGGGGGAAKDATGTTTRAKDTVASGTVEVAAAKQEVADAEKNVEAAKKKVAAAEKKLEAIEDQLCEGGLSAEKRKVLEDRKNRAQKAHAVAHAAHAVAQAAHASAQRFLDAQRELLVEQQRNEAAAAASGGGGGGGGGAAASGGSGGGDAGHKWVQTSDDQLPASSFVSSKNKPLQGAGMFFSVPAYMTDADDQALRDLGIDLPAHDDHAVQQLCRQLQPLVMGSRSLGHFHETRGSTSMSTSRVVQQSHLDQLCTIMNKTTLTRMPLWQTTSVGRDITMESLDCPFGVVSRSSEPRGYILRAIDGAEKPVVGGIVEAKSTAYAPIEALRQGFSESTNVALTQRRLGLECTEVRIPVWATTGQQMQLGVTRMLQPAFAYLTVVSKALDLNDPTDRLLAARLLIATRKLCARPLVCNPADRFAGMELFLSLDAYHRKDLGNVFTTCGSDADITLSHMQRQLSKLVGTPAAACAVAPITMYYDKRKEWLVFPNLTPAGFVIGMPEDDDVGTYLAAVGAAVQAIHDAGVVHLDLYPSNIMWRKIEGVGEHADHPQVEVKIIDWDTAHAKDGPLARFLRDRLLTLPLRRRLVEREGGNPYCACGEWDTTLIAVLQWAASAREWREALQTTDKTTLDRKFWECAAAYNKSLHTDGGSSEQVGQ